MTDEALVEALAPGRDAIVHFAAESHVDRSIAGAAPFLTSNVIGTRVLLDAALRHGTGRFVQVSTDEVYGSIDAGSWAEDQPVAPRSPYAASKAGADLLALAYHHTHGLDVVVTRGSNTYGPYQHPEKVIPRFVTALLSGGTVPLYGDGLHVRDWVHVRDHCAGIALALARGRAGEVYHLGGGVELTNRELTGRLLAACGAGWERVEQVADRKGHDRRYSLDDRQGARGAGLGADGRLRRRAGRDGGLVPRQPRLVGGRGTPDERRAPTEQTPDPRGDCQVGGAGRRGRLVAAAVAGGLAVAAVSSAPADVGRRTRRRRASRLPASAARRRRPSALAAVEQPGQRRAGDPAERAAPAGPVEHGDLELVGGDRARRAALAADAAQRLDRELDARRRATCRRRGSP